MDMPGVLQCPNCREPEQVRATVKTDVGSYYYCNACHHAWHRDFAPPPGQIIPPSRSPRDAERHVSPNQERGVEMASHQETDSPPERAR